MKLKAKLKIELLELKNLNRNLAYKIAPAHIQDIELGALGLSEDNTACVFCANGVNMMINMRGELQYHSGRISSLFKDLHPPDYLRINRYCMVHRLLVFQYQKYTSRRLKLVLRQPFQVLVPESHKIVSQSKRDYFIKNLKRWDD